MRKITGVNKFISLLFVLLFSLVTCWGQCVSGENQSVDELLLQKGAKKISKDGNSYELRGASFSICYEDNVITGIEVEFSEERSSKRYLEILEIIKAVKSIGDKVNFSNWGVVSPSGYLTRRLDFSEAIILRTEKNCRNAKAKNNNQSCEITRLKVSYWMPFEGIIDSKRVESIELSETIKVKKYFVQVGNLEVEIRQEDFDRLRIGDQIKGRRVISGSLPLIH